MSPTPAIEARRLVKRYGATTAVDAISFAVEAGTVVGLLGGNGAGKTTTIGMIMGLTLPSAGEVRALGVDMARDRYRALGRMNFESPYVDMPHRLTVRQNLRVFGRLYGVASVEDASKRWPRTSRSNRSSIGRPAAFRPARRRASLWPRR